VLLDGVVDCLMRIGKKEERPVGSHRICIARCCLQKRRGSTDDVGDDAPEHSQVESKRHLPSFFVDKHFILSTT
jgi:hypothetical protein